MALGDSYATLLQLKARLSIDPADIKDDLALINSLSASSRAIEGLCGRQFNDAGAGSESPRIYYPDDLATVYTDDFQSSGGFVLAFDFSNAGSYTSVIAAANYQLEPLNGIMDGTPGWPFYRIHIIQTWTPVYWVSIGYPRTSVQVTARWGWAAVPSSVTEACLILAEDLFKVKDTQFGVAGFDANGAVRVRENPKVGSLLMRYQRSPIQVA